MKTNWIAWLTSLASNLFQINKGPKPLNSLHFVASSSQNRANLRRLVMTTCRFTLFRVHFFWFEFLLHQLAPLIYFEPSKYSITCQLQTSEPRSKILRLNRHVEHFQLESLKVYSIIVHILQLVTIGTARKFITSPWPNLS